MPPPIPDKTVLIPFCKFLKRKRLFESGVMEPFTIRFREFNEIFSADNATELDSEKLAALKREFKKVIVDGKNRQRQPLVIVEGQSARDIWNDFENHYRQNDEITLSYDKEDIQWYIDRLEIGLAEMRAGINFERLVFDAERRHFNYRGATMQFRKTEATKSIRLNLCLLLYGQSLTYIDGWTTQHPDIRSESASYALGDHVHIDVITKLLLFRGDIYYNDLGREQLQKITKKYHRKIRDAVNGLNKRSNKDLGIKIFNYEDQEIWLNRP